MFRISFIHNVWKRSHYGNRAVPGVKPGCDRADSKYRCQRYLERPVAARWAAYFASCVGSCELEREWLMKTNVFRFCFGRLVVCRRSSVGESKRKIITKCFCSSGFSCLGFGLFFSAAISQSNFSKKFDKNF